MPLLFNSKRSSLVINQHELIKVGKKKKNHLVRDNIPSYLIRRKYNRPFFRISLN